MTTDGAHDSVDDDDLMIDYSDVMVPLAMMMMMLLMVMAMSSAV